MSGTRSELDAMITAAQLNPMAVQKAGIRFLERVRNGEVEVVDASNAFVYLGEMAATMFANSMRRKVLLNNMQYPEQALTRMDLYHHMSTVDYINTFASPSVARLAFALNKEEVIAKAVPTGNAGMKKFVIPRNTQVMVGTFPFTFQYPVEIRVLPHGGLQIVYDNSRPSPMLALETNGVTNSIENYNTDHTEYIQIEVDAFQMEQKSYVTPLSASKVFDKAYKYNDKYYHCRVYASNADGSWSEIKTTHSDQVFDPLVPTALLQVIDDSQLRVRIPQIYYTTGLVSRELRIDIFTTKGAMEVAVNTYKTDMFVPTWVDYDKDEKGKYTAPIKSMIDMFIVATTPATGGSNEISFEKLKERVINNALGVIDLPITNVQIQSQLDRLTDAGFSCVTEIDNTTKRIYLATRELPAPDIQEVSTGVGSNVVTLMKSTNEILTQANVMDNGERITILPSTLYRNEGGFLSIVSKEELASIKALAPDILVDRVTQGNFLYTPFHYVYDFVDNVFTVRPYYFGDPKITRKFFVDDNGTMGVGVNSSDHDFIRTETGWVLRVRTNSTDSLKELDDDSLKAQIAFVPYGETGRAYKNGTLVGRDPSTKEWIFEFAFDSTWDVAYDAAAKEHSVYLDGFQSEGIAPHPYPAKLSTVFDIFYAVEEAAVEEGEVTDIDNAMGKFLITDMKVVALYQEQVTMTLGYELSGLWARARSVIGEESYVRYDEDVPKRYTSNEPLRDDKQNIVMEQDASGTWRVVYKHKIGDIKYLEDGSVDWLHRNGDVMMQDGAPVVANPRSINRQVELCLFDGVYYFANATTDADYKATVPTQIVEWVNLTLAPIRKKVLEQTELKFHPKGTIGRINAIVDGSLIMSIEAAQFLNITYFTSEKVTRDEELKAQIRRTTREVITRLFKESMVTRDAIEAELKAVMGDDVIAVEVNGLGGVQNYRVISMADDSSRLVIGRKLNALPNGTFGVEDRIEIMFDKHAVPA